MRPIDTTRDMLVASLRSMGMPIPRSIQPAVVAIEDEVVPKLVGLLSRTADATKRAKLSSALDHLSAAKRLIREATR